MLGATDTTMGPDVAPTGIVTAMDVLLQELIVSGEPLNSAALLPCDAPNPDPEIVIWLPTGPVVADKFVITGAGDAAELIDTLSKVAVARLELFRLLTPSPTYTFCAIVIVWLAPNCVQFTPSGDA
jgi:hypothetical protein